MRTAVRNLSYYREAAFIIIKHQHKHVISTTTTAATSSLRRLGSPCAGRAATLSLHSRPVVYRLVRAGTWLELWSDCVCVPGGGGLGEHGATDWVTVSSFTCAVTHRCCCCSWHAAISITQRQSPLLVLIFAIFCTVLTQLFSTSL